MNSVHTHLASLPRVQDAGTGLLMTVHDLPAPESIQYWMPSKKKLMLDIVKHKLLSKEDVCERYDISSDEFERWKRLNDRGGIKQLRHLHDDEPAPAELPPFGSKTVGNLTVDFDRGEASLSGVLLDLTPNEYAILAYLASRVGEVVTWQMFRSLLHKHKETPPEKKIYDVFLCKLRKKIAKITADRYIKTVWGRGCRLTDPTKAASHVPA